MCCGASLSHCQRWLAQPDEANREAGRQKQQHDRSGETPAEYGIATTTESAA
jgi:hypothetical protein